MCGGLCWSQVPVYALVRGKDADACKSRLFSMQVKYGLLNPQLAARRDEVDSLPADEAQAVSAAAEDMDSFQVRRRDGTVFALNYCLPSTTVCLSQLLVALNYCLPSTAVCPQLLFALNCCLPSTNLDIRYDRGT